MLRAAPSVCWGRGHVIALKSRFPTVHSWRGHLEKRPWSIILQTSYQQPLTQNLLPFLSSFLSFFYLPKHIVSLILPFIYRDIYVSVEK